MTAVSVAAAAGAVAAVGASGAWALGADGVPTAVPLVLSANTAVQVGWVRLGRRWPAVAGQLSAATWTLSNVLLTLATPPGVAHVVGPLGLLVVALIGTISAAPGAWHWGPVAVAAWWGALAAGGVSPTDLGPVAAFPAVILIGTVLLVSRMTRQLHQSETSLRDALRMVEARSDEAERANRAKSTFLTSMSHELRTPLNAIIGYSELLEEQSDDDVVRSDAARIRRAGQHLLALVNDLLDMARIEAGRLRLDPRAIDPRAVLTDLKPVAETLARERGNELRWDVEASTPPKVVADELRLRQVLLNILGNALKFTSNGVVRLSAWGDATGWRVRIEDNGPGIDAETRARLFQPFGQGSLRAAGSGLGLAISRELLARMGGTVELVSPPDSAGTTFDVWLPRSAE